MLKTYSYIIVDLCWQVKDRGFIHADSKNRAIKELKKEFPSWEIYLRAERII